MKTPKYLYSVLFCFLLAILSNNVSACGILFPILFSALGVIGIAFMFNEITQKNNKNEPK